MTTTEESPKIVHDLHFSPTAIGAAQEPKREVKIAYIGGGSRAWAVHLMQDLALSSTLCGELRLYDIDHEAAVYNEQLGECVFSHPDARTSFNVRAVKSLSAALTGVDFVVISIEPGPSSLRYADLEIPAKYGILQTVGDTTGPGGILRALRSAPLFAEFGKAVMEHCPKAWVINYTNPMAVCTAALFASAPEIKAFGCCHEVFGTQKKLAKHVSEWFGVETPARQEIHLEISGVNHFTWASRATWQGHDLLERLKETIAADGFFEDATEKAEDARAKGEWFGSGLIAYDLLRRFGALGAAGDRHLAEFVPWYLTSEAELHRWGVVATPYSWRMERQQSPRKPLNAVSSKPLAPSGEEGVYQMEALLGLKPMVTNVNLPNRGQIPSLPLGALVETYAEFRQDSVVPLIAGALPPGAETLVRRAAEEQVMVAKAGLMGDYDLAFQALMVDPLVHLSTDVAWKMFQEMLEATREMLPVHAKR